MAAYFPDDGSNYHLVERIGHGAFGQVYKAQSKQDPGSIYAIKKIDETDATAQREVDLLKTIQHPYIVKYIDSYIDVANRYLCIVMEYGDRGTLTSFINKNPSPQPEYRVWRFVNHMAGALAFLHQHHIFHRDFKPDNIIGITEWDDDEKRNAVSWKVADFGLSKLVSPDALGRHYAHTRCGTIIYMAPEVLGDDSSTTGYNEKADVWSLGAVMSFFCNRGEHLFKSLRSVLSWLGDEDCLPGRYSEHLRQLVMRMLSPDPRRRPSALEVERECTNERQELGLH